MKKNQILLITLLAITIISISYIYTTIPRLQLNGKNQIILSYREKYEEPGVIVKNANSNYVSKIKIDDNINNEKTGNYYVDYSLKIGLRKLHIKRNVKIIDDIPPVIKLKGNQIIEQSINEEYKEPGFEAIDEYDGDITTKVEIIGKVNIEKYGEYVLKYKVKDNSNNEVEINRIVKIVDEVPPKIECKGNYTAFKIGTENIIGCTAIDNFDGNITSKIKTSGIYDTQKPGFYTVEYKVSDEAGNTSEKKHKIYIYDTPKKEENYEIQIAFTINNSENIEQILGILKEEKIKSTFLINPDKINQQTINHIIEEGHELGINGYEYDNETYKQITKLKKIIEDDQKNILNKTGKRINKYLLPEEITKQTRSDIIEYLKDNNINYYDKLKKITINEYTQIIENQIKNIQATQMIIFDIKEIESSTLEEIEDTLQVLKDMNYKFIT